MYSLIFDIFGLPVGMLGDNAVFLSVIVFSLSSFFALLWLISRMISIFGRRS